MNYGTYDGQGDAVVAVVVVQFHHFLMLSVLLINVTENNIIGQSCVHYNTNVNIITPISAT